MSATYETPIGNIVFSSEGGIIWASWPGKGTTVELGHYDGVTHMMRDFLDQCDLAERMAGRTVNDD